MIQYLAGIFDAEGYVRIRKNKSGIGYSYTYECRIYMTNKDIIDLFSFRYNLPIKTCNRGINRKLAYYVTLNGRDLRNTTFISDLLPYLNEKREQLAQIFNIINGIDKEEAYQKYMIAKQSFDSSLIREPSFEYIAGIIDGDGWFTMFNASKQKDSPINRFCFGLEQRYKPMVDYLLKFGGNVTKRKVLNEENHVQTYEWKITTSNMLFLLEKIQPFLVEKQQTCKKFIEYINKFEEFKKYSLSLL